MKLLQVVDSWMGVCSEMKELLEPLSAREMEVLTLLATGSSNQEIAAHLVIAPNTAKRHVKNILGKLAANNRTQAVALAREAGLLEHS